MLFREGITPEWEDKKNKRGGHFTYEMENPDTVESDDVWKE